MRRFSLKVQVDEVELYMLKVRYERFLVHSNQQVLYTVDFRSLFTYYMFIGSSVCLLENKVDKTCLKMFRVMCLRVRNC